MNQKDKKAKKVRAERERIELIRVAVFSSHSACPDIEKKDAAILLREIDRLRAEIAALKAKE